MTINAIRKLFTVAALFNFAVALPLLIAPAWLMGLMHITPAIEPTVWVQQFAGLVLTFGIGYYWISRDPYGNRSLINLGIIGKSLVVVVGLWNVAAGEVSWQFMIPASADGVFALLFYRAGRALQH